MKKLEPFVDGHIESWLARLSKLYAEQREVFDFAPWATYLAYDVISDIAFGSPLGMVEKGEDVGNLIKGLHTGWLIFGLLSRLYPVKNFLNKTWLMKKIIVAGPNDKSGFGVLMKVGLSGREW